MRKEEILKGFCLYENEGPVWSGVEGGLYQKCIVMGLISNPILWPMGLFTSLEFIGAVIWGAQLEKGHQASGGTELGERVKCNAGSSVCSVKISFLQLSLLLCSKAWRTSCLFTGWDNWTQLSSLHYLLLVCPWILQCWIMALQELGWGSAPILLLVHAVLRKQKVS